MAEVTTMPASPPKAYSLPLLRTPDNASPYPPSRARSRGNTPPPPSIAVHRKSVPLPAVKIDGGTMGSAPSSPVRVQEGVQHHHQTAQIEDHGSLLSAPSSRSTSGHFSIQELTPPPDPSRLSPSPQLLPKRPGSVGDFAPAPRQRSLSAASRPGNARHDSALRYTPDSSGQPSLQTSLDNIQHDAENYQPLQYFHQAFDSRPSSADHLSSQRPFQERQRAASGPLNHITPRPDSVMSSGSEMLLRGRKRSPVHTPDSYARAISTNSLSRSPDVRPLSYVDLLNVPYPQAPPVSVENLDHSHLRGAVGNNASLLSTTQTLEMYRANVKKTNDPAIQYEFAVFMITCAQEAALDDSRSSADERPYGSSPVELLKEARHILHRLADRSYPFAQYYLGDGYASGLFTKGKEDYDKAFPLFISASKHGHAEAGYRAALCYEFGWGTKVDAYKAIQFYRQSASKNHPGAMLRLGRACLVGDLGLTRRYKEGVKWLKRAAETADFQYNSAPYELGLLHETGYGDDIFQDEAYAAQLFTKSADLGHPDANYKLGDAYEHGKLTCPRDPALSVHFYTNAAQMGHPLAMMALCAWYMVGADPILEKDENEAYEWAKRAAETDLPKAEYCVGYFTEMGIGCRRDTLEANVWYVRAAGHGDQRAKHRLDAIRKAGSGTNPDTAAAGAKLSDGTNGRKGSEYDDHPSNGRKKKFGIF